MVKPHSRTGFTLIELLVAVAIIGILCSLILAGVSSSRAAARRARCLANVRQIGQALASHHASWNAFPPAFRAEGRSSGSGALFSCPTPASVLVELLPYLDSGVLYHSFNFGPFRTRLYPSNRDIVINNVTVRSTAVPVFLCPADSGYGNQPGVSYRACGGPNPTEFEGTPWPGGGGAFPGFTGTSAPAFTDGLSNTVGFAERLIGSGDGARFNTRRDVWLSELSAVDPGADADATRAVCASLRNRNPNSFLGCGRFWTDGCYRYTLYNHVDLPNPQGADCSSGGAEISGGSIATRSWHSGGVNVLLMDGSATFVKSSISLSVWRALATRAGGETVGSVF